MSRKHYAAMAQAIALRLRRADSDAERASLIEIAQAIASVCATANPRFNRERFLTAAGVAGGAA